MRKLILCAALSTLLGCDTSTVIELQSETGIEEPQTVVITTKKEEINPVINAIKYINFSEKNDRQELKELTGVDPVRTEWCAAFVNAVLDESGIENNESHPYPLTARAFLDWGTPVSKEDIQPGDIVVFPRGNQGWQGHVGFYLRTFKINGVDYYYILGGNQNNMVSIVSYRSSKALGIRRQLPI